eukprot:Pgem_evm1s16399
MCLASTRKLNVVIFSALPKCAELLIKIAQYRNYNILAIVTGQGPPSRRSESYKDILEL